MKKVLMFIGGFIIAIVIIVIAVFAITSMNSEKLVCESKEGNITLMYNEERINGYTAKGITYDLDTANKTAEEVGMEKYIEAFIAWFESNTSGTCTKK